MTDDTERDPIAAETPSETEEEELETEELEEAEEGEVEDDSEEVEHDGAKYRIPKALKGGFLMQADYTRKTQDLAEQRRALDGDRESFTKEAEARRQSEKDIGRIAVMDEALADYQKVDWPTFRSTHPEQANSAFQDYALLRDKRDALASKVHNDVAERSQKTQQDFAKRYAETNATLAKDIPGWNDELATNLRNFALAGGASQQDIITLAVNAPLVKLLHKAWLGEQLIAKKSAAAKAAKAQAPAAEVKPLTPVQRRPGGSVKAGLHDDLSIDEWMKRANNRARKS